MDNAALIKKRSKTAVSKKTVFLRKKGWKNSSVTVQDRTVLISSAIGQYLHERVDIYECENVFGLVNSTDGEYHVIALSSVSDRKTINSRPLVQ